MEQHSSTSPCVDTSNKTMQCHSHLGFELCSMLDKVNAEIFNGGVCLNDLMGRWDGDSVCQGTAGGIWDPQRDPSGWEGGAKQGSKLH